MQLYKVKLFCMGKISVSFYFTENCSLKLNIPVLNLIEDEVELTFIFQRKNSPLYPFSDGAINQRVRGGEREEVKVPVLCLWPAKLQVE